MWWVLVAAAFAGEPASWVNDSGMVTGTVSLPTSPAATLALLSDPVRVNSVDGGDTKVVVVAREGSCTVLDYTSPSVMSDIKYRVRQCPKGDGIESVLVQSDAFSSYRARWTLTPEGAGTLARYDLDMEVSMMVPNSLVQQTTKRAVYKMLERLLSYTNANR
jgi:hypothetical protein